MITNSLKEFIKLLDSCGEVLRVQEEVSPILEISEIADRISKSPDGGKALLFENVKGSNFPVLINAFGSWNRMNLALGVKDVNKIAKDIEKYLKTKPPTSLLDKAKLLPMLLEASFFPPKLIHSKSPPCQEVILTGDQVDLSILPILQCWPLDAGRFITFPMVINRSVDQKVRNVGLYRMQVFDKNTTAMHWHIHKDGAHFFHDYRKQNKRMEIAVAIGADPASCYAASAPLPYGIDEFLLAGFIRKKPVQLVKCKTVDLEVPANSEIVLEGYIDPRELKLEGPFGDHTGYYSQDGEYPVFHLTAITHRKDPIYLTTIVGKPPQEDYYLGKATERIFLPLLQTQLPELVDMNMPLEGVFHNCVIVSIDKRFPMQARRLMSTLWGAGQMSFVKIIVVVDSEINVHDEKQVLQTILNNIDIEIDLFFSEGILDVLNHASNSALYGSKLGIDATQKIDGEPKSNKKPNLEPVTPSKNLDTLVKQNFHEIKNCRVIDLNTKCPIMLVSIEKTKAEDVKNFFESFFEDSGFKEIGILIAFESHVDLNNKTEVLWKLFNNLDPERDTYVDHQRIAIDITQKFPEEGYTQQWPEEIEMSQDIKDLVDKKWNSIFK